MSRALSSRLLVIALAAGWWLPELIAGAAEPMMVTSRSKQFIVHGPNPILSRPPPALHTSAKLLRLDPALLAASGEDIKEALLNELGIPPRQSSASRFRAGPESKIYLIIHPPIEDEVIIEAIPSDTGWTYRVILPPQIESKRLVTALVKVLLLERANRAGPDQIAEVPPWLVVGFSAHLQASAIKPLTLESTLPLGQTVVQPGAGQWAVLGNSSTITVSKLRLDASAPARERLRKSSPFSFEELSWPDGLPMDRYDLFEDAAHLFVQELLRLKDGPALLRECLDELPNHWNWQFAFLRAFQPHFSSLLDVEKWWGLALAYTRRLEPEQNWRLHESWRTLENNLRVPVQIHHSPDALPLKDFLSFQDVIQQWPASEQPPVLEPALQQLASLRLRLPLELAPLLDGYLRALQNYLHKLPQAAPANPRRGRHPLNIAVLKSSTCRLLDALDQQRIALLPKLFPSTREDAIRSAIEVADQKIAARPALLEEEQPTEVAQPISGETFK